MRYNNVLTTREKFIIMIIFIIIDQTYYPYQPLVCQASFTPTFDTEIKASNKKKKIQKKGGLIFK
jgi:hypothetical protein